MTKKLFGDSGQPTIKKKETICIVKIISDQKTNSVTGEESITTYSSLFHGHQL